MQMELNAPLNSKSTETDRELALALMRDEAVVSSLHTIDMVYVYMQCKGWCVCNNW